MKDSKLNQLCKWEKYLETLCKRAKYSSIHTYDDLVAGYHDIIHHLEKCEKEIDKLSDLPITIGIAGIEFPEADAEWEGRCRVLIEKTRYRATDALLRSTANEINKLHEMKMLRVTKWK